MADQKKKVPRMILNIQIYPATNTKHFVEIAGRTVDGRFILNE